MEEKNSAVQKKKTIGLIHKIYLIQLKSKRNYTASTKRKAEVRGGGKKPWRQKGTGQARAGSIRSPLWVGGGVVFGPKPHIVKKKANKKERRIATFSAFSLKKDDLIFFDNNLFENKIFYKTKELVKKLKELNIDFSNKNLLIIEEQNQELYLASRNIKNLMVTTPYELCLENILNSKKIFLSNKSFIEVKKIYGKSYN